MAAMGMFSANDLKQIASSKIDFGDDNGNTETKSDNGSEPPAKPSATEQNLKSNNEEKSPKPEPRKSKTKSPPGDMKAPTELESKSKDEGKPEPEKADMPPPKPTNVSQPVSTVKPGPAADEGVPEEESFEGRPVEVLLKDANWKARKFAYEALEKEHFLEASKGAPFASELVNIAGEKSMGAMDPALRCLIAYTKSCMQPPTEESNRDLQEKIVALLIKKPLVGRTSTKKLAIELLLLMAELGKEGVTLVSECLEKGLGEKSPKIQQCVLEVLESCVNGFGPSVLPVMVFKTAVLRGLALKPPLVRKQALSLAVTLDLHMKGAFFAIVQPEIPSESQKRDMEQAIDKNKGQSPPTPTRAIRGIETSEATPTGAASVDAYDFLEARNILDKVEKMNLEKRMALPKWAERKAALVEVEKLCGNPPKLAKGDYSGLAAVLRSTLQRDSNQAVVVQVIKLYGVLACGLRDEFSSYGKAIVGTLLAKLKDKKMALVMAVEKTIEDLVRYCFSLFDDKVLASLKQAFLTNSTQPQRLKIVSFIERSLKDDKVWMGAEAAPEGLKELLELGVQALEDADSKVRDAAIQLFSSIRNRKEPVSVVNSVQGTLEDISKRIPRAFAKITEGTSTGNAEHKPKAKPKRSAPQRPSSKAPQKAKAKPTTRKPPAPVPGKTVAETVDLMSVNDASAVAQTLAGIPEAIKLFDAAEKWQDKVHLFEEVGKQVEGCTQETAQALIVFLGSRTRQFKDSNFNIMNKAWEAIGKLLPVKPNEAYIGSFLPAAVSKLGDKKQKTYVNSLLLDAIEVYGPTCIISKIITVLNNGKSGPKVNEEALNFMSSCLEQFGGKQMACAVKSIVEHSSGSCGLGAKQMPVKIAASKLLVKSYEHCGEKVKKLLGDPELDRMQSAFDKANVVDKTFAPPRSINGQKTDTETPEADILGQRKDLSGSFSPELFKQLSDTVSKNSWKIRFKAIDDIVKVFENANRYVAHNRAVTETVSELKKRLNDSNRNLVAKAIRALGVIGQSVGSSSAPAIIRQAGKALLGCLTDSNKTILSSVYESLSHWCVFDDATVAAPFFQLVAQCGIPLGSVKHDRAGLLKWLLQHFPASAPEDELVQLVKPSLSCLQSRDASTRKMAGKMVSKLVALLGDTRGKDLFQASCRDLKPAVTRSLNPLLQKAYAEAGSAPAQTAMDTSAREASGTRKDKARAPREREKKSKSRRASSPRMKIRSPTGRQQTSTAEDDSGPVFLVVESSFKLKRVEKGRRKKWPIVIEEKDRAELVADLRHDLEKVVSIRLVNMMFADTQEGAAQRSFRGAELEPAFKTLLAEVPNSASQVLECLDLILKWTTLHLSSNNSTVTGHVLQLLESLFELCCGADYRLLEVEAAAFVPHLVLKLGEKQKRFRECVRNLLRLVCQCYPVSKLVPFLLSELSNRNVYVVSECVDECTLLVDKHGPSLLKLKPVHSKHTMLRSIAELVGDSRKDVRNAALRFVEAVWELESRDLDKLFKRITAHKAVLDNKTQTLVQNHLSQASTKTKTPGKGCEPMRKNHKALPKSPRPSAAQSPMTPPLPRKQVSSSLFDMELPTTPPSPNVQSPFSPDDSAQATSIEAAGSSPVQNGGMAYTPLISLVERIKCAHLDLADFSHANALNALELLAGDSAPEGCNYSCSEWLHLLAEHLDVNRAAKALARELQNGEASSDTKALVAQALLTISWNNVLSMKLESDTVVLIVHDAFAVLSNSSADESAIELEKTVQAVLVKLSSRNGWFTAMLCRLVESGVDSERVALVHCIETYIDEQENESDPYMCVEMTKVVEALQRLVVDSQHKGLCEAIVKSMLSAGKRFTEHLAPSSTLRVVVARCLLQNKNKSEAGQGSDENEKKQPQTEAPAVNVASIRERLGRLRKDYLNISANSPGKATLDSIRARMARQKKP